MRGFSDTCALRDDLKRSFTIFPCEAVHLGDVNTHSQIY